MIAASASRNPRHQTVTLVAAFLLGGLLTACTERADPEGTPRRVAREIDRTLTTVARNELARDPELASRLGLEEQAAGYRYTSYLTDRSQAAYERARLSRLETRDLLVRLTRPARGSALARDLDTVIAAHERAEPLFMPGHGVATLNGAYPYVADHTRGAYIDVPDILARFHPLNTPADARSFADRMAQFADAIDDDRRRMEADAQAGIIPPAPILRRMLATVSTFATREPGTGPAVTRFETFLPDIAGLSEEDRAQLIEDVRRMDRENVQPAYAAFAETLNRLSQSAPEFPGVWQLPEGPAYYASALRAFTGDDASPAGLHERGKREVDALVTELDRALTGIGLIEGSVAERLTFIASQPDQIYPDTEEGRDALMARLAEHAARAEARIVTQFDLPPAGPISLRIVPEAFTPHAPAAAFFQPAANNSSPARVELDLSRLEEWPDFTLASVAFHEIIPGHHYETAAMLQEGNLPLARRLIWNVAYGEGWASYAETLADELGLYSEDPLSRIGYLQSMLLRAAQLVADTGLHHERWSRDQAIAYLTQTTGISRTMAMDEVDRFTVRPGYGAAYWLGRERFLDLRERAIRVLGPRFDPKAFHRVILTGGPRPLRMVDEDVTRWYTVQIEN